MTAKVAADRPEPEPPSSAIEPAPNWLQRRRQRDAELAALNAHGESIANRYPQPMVRAYIGTVRRPRPRRR